MLALFMFVANSSNIIDPSNKPTILFEYLAASSTWCKLHMIVILNSLLIFFNNDIIRSAALGSRLATGSSANNNVGFFIIALAIPTLCLCPPESSSARLYALSKSPTVSSAFRACNFCSFVRGLCC